MLLISSDDHVSEPLDLWSTRLPKHLRALGPRHEVIDGRSCIVVDKDTVVKRSGKVAASSDAEGVKQLESEARQGFVSMGENDPTLRLRDLDQDGIWGDVIYPNLAFFCAFRMSNPELQVPTCTVYNDWIGETFLDASDRFCPVALLPVLDVDASVKELERVADRGFRAVLLPDHLDIRPYNDPVYEPLWAAAAEIGMPLTMHVGTGRNQNPARGKGAAIVNYVVTVTSPVETVTYFCASGILARHPDLKVVIVESGSGWLAWALHAMDDSYREHQKWVDPKLDMLPSEYFRRQGYVTFQYDPVGLANVPITGDDCLMWGADYPHPEGTWPNTASYLEKQLAGVPAETVEKILWRNAAELYKFRLPDRTEAPVPA